MACPKDSKGNFATGTPCAKKAAEAKARALAEQSKKKSSPSKPVKK